MDNNQLRQWRDQRDISQARLASALGITRDVLANWEYGRSGIPEGIESQLAGAEALLQGENTTPKAAQLPADYYRDALGELLTRDQVKALPHNSYYFKKYPWPLEDGRDWYILFIRRRDYGEHLGGCTGIQLDATGWHVVWPWMRETGWREKLAVIGEKLKDKREAANIPLSDGPWWLKPASYDPD